MRLAVLGCGVVAGYGHLPSIRKVPGLQLELVYDPNPDRAADYGSRFGCQGISDFEQVFEHSLDAVIVTSPLFTHHPNVLQAAQAGLHVFCEKPIAGTIQEANEMIAAMEAAKKSFFITLVYRFSRVAQTLKQWLKDGVIGEVRHIRMVYLWDLHGEWELGTDQKWMRSPRWKGRMDEGGPLIDCGVHQVDLIRWMTGLEVLKWEGFGAWVSDYEAPDHLTAHLQLEGGITATVEVSFTYGHTARHPSSVFTYELIGTGGVAKFDRNGYQLEARTGAEIVNPGGTGEKDFDEMYRQYHRFLTTGETGDLASPKDALVATHIANGCTEDAIRRRLTAPRAVSPKV